MNEEASPPARESRGLRIAWFSFALAVLIGGFLLVLNLILRHHTESQRNTCQAILSQIEMSLKQYQLDHGLPGDLTQLPKSEHPLLDPLGHPLLDPWGRPLVYRVHREQREFKGKVVNVDRFELYSVGPNGIDENGAGDDITKRD